MNHPIIVEFKSLARYMARWLPLALLVGAMAGTASAWFLFALDWATATRLAHRWLILAMPLMGFAVGWVYLRYGRSVEAGNNLLIEEIHSPQKRVPLRMAPLVLLGTVASHLVGASVGREGTAVQMGGSLADQLNRVFRFDPAQRRILLMTGLSAGFASVFGVPLAGAIFGLEVLAIGRLRYDALFPCLLCRRCRRPDLFALGRTSHGLPGQYFSADYGLGRRCYPDCGRAVRPGRHGVCAIHPCARRVNEALDQLCAVAPCAGWRW